MVYNVSTSEVATFLTCQRRWMYAHHPSYNLEPRTLGPALTRGIEGHKALELFFESRMNGLPYKEAVDKANHYIMTTTLNAVSVGDSVKADMLGELGTILQEYWPHTDEQLRGYNIYGVENVVYAPLPGVDHVQFAGRVDVSLEVANGPYKGNIEPFDHKFCYNFWNEASIMMNAQLPNYQEAFNHMGLRSSKGHINMIRHRLNAQERFKTEEVVTNKAIRDEFFRNHVNAAVKIVALKETRDVRQVVSRSISKFNCEYCPFYRLCRLELEGKDPTNIVAAQYRKNSYGYDSELDVD